MSLTNLAEYRNEHPRYLTGRNLSIPTSKDICTVGADLAGFLRSRNFRDVVLNYSHARKNIELTCAGVPYVRIAQQRQGIVEVDSIGPNLQGTLRAYKMRLQHGN